MTVRIDPLRNPSGFALVGVVMFVLVLTILGLSLFSLTSFESQFLNISVSRSESFYAASDGIERARFTLVASGRLETVRSQVPDGTIVWASARQGQGSFTAVPDSDGLVDWTGAKGDVWIRTLAIQRGHELLEARFKPNKPEDYYRRLLTLSGDLTVVLANPPPPPIVPRFTTLVGEIWKNGPNPVPVQAGPGWTLKAGGGVVPPDVVAFAQHMAAGEDVADSHPSANHERYVLNAGGASYKFFRTRANGAELSVDSKSPDIRVQVTGTVIWMLDRGFRADDEVFVDGSGVLVIVAGMTTNTSLDNKDRGFNLLGGLNSLTVPVVLVTDGICGIEHKNNTLHFGATLPITSIYARDAIFMGPDLPSQVFIYPSALGPLLDTLVALGVLPNTDAGVAERLKRLPGTWRDITDSTPI